MEPTAVATGVVEGLSLELCREQEHESTNGSVEGNGAEGNGAEGNGAEGNGAEGNGADGNGSDEFVDRNKKDAVNKELQQLAFRNPGPLTAAVVGFNPDLSNRERRKLNRILEQQNAKASRGKEASKSRPRRQALHDNSGCLLADGRDLCDCQDPECPGCHYPCSQCGYEKCGVTCRCDRKWSYERIDVYNERTVVR